MGITTNASNVGQVSGYPEGANLGNTTTDKIAFYGTNYVAQQSNTVDLVTQLVNLGLVASGTTLQTNGASIAAGSTKTLTAADSGKTILLNTAAGSVVTLPAATGSGITYKFLVSVLATSNSHKVQVANSSDYMVGSVFTMSDDAGNVAKAFFAANSGTVSTNSDTITLNRSTTGSVTVGESIEVKDVAANIWAVNGFTSSTGTEATPFSAAV